MSIFLNRTFWNGFVEGINPHRENLKEALKNIRNETKLWFLKTKKINMIMEKIYIYGNPFFISFIATFSLYNFYFNFNIINGILMIFIYRLLIEKFNSFYKNMKIKYIQTLASNLCCDFLVAYLEKDNIIDAIIQVIQSMDNEIIEIKPELKFFIMVNLTEISRLFHVRQNENNLQRNRDIVEQSTNILQSLIFSNQRNIQNLFHEINSMNDSEAPLSQNIRTENFEIYISRAESFNFIEENFPEDAITMESITDNFAYTLNESDTSFISHSTLRSVFLNSPNIIPKNPFTNEYIIRIKKWSKINIYNFEN